MKVGRDETVVKRSSVVWRRKEGFVTESGGKEFRLNLCRIMGIEESFVGHGMGGLSDEGFATTAEQELGRLASSPHTQLWWVRRESPEGRIRESYAFSPARKNEVKMLRTEAQVLAVLEVMEGERMYDKENFNVF